MMYSLVKIVNFYIIVEIYIKQRGNDVGLFCLRHRCNYLYLTAVKTTPAERMYGENITLDR